MVLEVREDLDDTSLFGVNVLTNKELVAGFLYIEGSQDLEVIGEKDFVASVAKC